MAWERRGGGVLFLLCLFFLLLFSIMRSISVKRTNKWEHLFNCVNLHINYPTELISTSPLLPQVPEELLLLLLLVLMLRSLSRH